MRAGWTNSPWTGSHAVVTLDVPPSPIKEEWQRVERFMADNPRIYRILVENCRLWVQNTGCQRWAIGAAWERLRWVLRIHTGEKFALDDLYRAYYARLVMDQEKDLAGMFELRSSSADAWLDWHNNGAQRETAVLMMEVA